MSHPIVERILQGEAPLAAKQAAARGSLPIPREDLIEIWAGLRNDSDPEIRMASRESLAGVQEEEWREVLPQYAFRKEVLEFALLVLGRNERILEAALRNPACPVEAVERVASQAKGHILDQILDNQTRLLEAPRVVVALLNNPSVQIAQVRRAYDLAEQFFRDHETIPALLEQKWGLRLGAAGGTLRAAPEAAPEIPPVPPPPSPPPEEAEGAPEAAVEGVVPEPLSQADVITEALMDQPLDEEQVKTLFQQVLTMSVPKKVELALKGNKEARGLLIRDSNKIIQMAVISSPKITEEEVEAIAKLRNMPAEIFRKLSVNRKWMKKYRIIKAIVFNPKAPPGLSLGLIKFLNDQDVKFLLKDKGVSDVMRREAKKLMEMKAAKKG